MELTSQRYGLSSAENAPFVVWGEQWLDTVATDLMIVTFAYFGSNALWLILALGSLIFGRYYPNRPKAA